MEITFIYGLKCPLSGQIRYIGKSNCPERRFMKHLRNARAGEVSHKANWIRSLLILRTLPVLEVLDEIPVSLWKNIEKDYIKVFRAIGILLTNQTAGGESPMEGRKHSVLSRLKMRAAHIERPHSPEHNAAVSAALLGRAKPSVSAETRAKMRLSALGNKSNTGRTLTLAHRANISAGGKGKKHIRKHAAGNP